MNKGASDGTKREAEEANEAEAKARKEAEEVAAIAVKAIRAIIFPDDSNGGTTEAKHRVKREAEETRERARIEAEEATRAKAAEVKAKKEAARIAREKAKREAEKARERAKKTVGAKLYSGLIKLAVVSPVDYEGVKKFEKSLSEVQNLRLVFVGGSVHEDTRIIVSTEKPIDLVKILSKMPLVQRVAEKGKEIRVALRAKQ